jgi:hypothetical protein
LEFYDIIYKAYGNNQIDVLFFANNILESYNSKINRNIIKNKNTFNMLRIQINNIINIYFI